MCDSAPCSVIRQLSIRQYMFGIPCRYREKLFVRLPLECSDYEESRLLATSLPMAFAYHFTLASHAERHNLFFPAERWTRKRKLLSSGS